MAIKGKKKSQSRGSQARRRPAAAPRAIATSRRRTAWYKTPQGRAALIVLFLIVAGVITGLVLHAKSNSDKLADRQDALERYTSSVRSVLQTMTPAASEMITAPTDPEDGAAILPLKKDGRGWEDIFNSATTEAATLRPTASAANANSILQQSIGLYLTSAQLYQLVPDEPDKTRGELLTSASTVRDQANQLWVNGTAIIDELRDDLDMAPSGLRSPSTAPPSGQATPAPEQTIPVESGDGGGGKKKGSKNGK
jgi:hypothetical protein